MYTEHPVSNPPYILDTSLFLLSSFSSDINPVTPFLTTF